MIQVTLVNQHAGCSIVATGRYPRAAYRRAVRLALPQFLRYRRGSDNSVWWAPSDVSWDSLFVDCLAEIKRHRQTRAVYHPNDGIGLEIRRL